MHIRSIWHHKWVTHLRSPHSSHHRRQRGRQNTQEKKLSVNFYKFFANESHALYRSTPSQSNGVLYIHTWFIWIRALTLCLAYSARYHEWTLDHRCCILGVKHALEDIPCHIWRELYLPHRFSQSIHQTERTEWPIGLDQVPSQSRYYQVHSC